jgi:hypothetical protein
MGAGMTALEIYRALLGRKEDDEPEEGALFALPEEPVVSCVPTCDWCGKHGDPIPADLGIGKRWGYGSTWGPMTSFAYLAITEHKRTGCERAHEHPEQLARLLADREPFDRETDDAAA